MGGGYKRDGSEMKISLFFIEPGASGSHGYERRMSPEEFGRWYYGLIDVSSVGPDRVRLRMSDDGLITGIGHATEDRWFDPRPADEIAGTSRQALIEAAALRHINTHRASYGQRPLDPSAAGWSSDDVLAHARDLGWCP